jgi:hypothetical protein
MSVFREVTLTWEGAEYTITPSMKLMRAIEMTDVSFMDIALRTSQGRPPMSHLATVIAKMLQSAGVPGLTEEKVYEKLILGTEDEITNLITGVMIAFSPQQGDEKGKKPAARTPAKK